MRLRMRPAGPRSIRAVLAVLFVVPLASLLALWGFAASVTMSNAVQERNFTDQDQLYGGQAQALGVDLALERSASFVWLSTKMNAPTGPLITQRKLTDKAVAAFISGVSASPAMIPSSARPALANFVAALHRLGGIRAAIDSGRLSPLAEFAEYNAIINAQFRLYSQLIVVNDISLYRQEAASLDAGRAIELADREVTLVNGALAGGLMNRVERILFAQIVAEQRALMSDALDKLDPSLSAGYRGIETSPAYRKFARLENRIIASIGSDAPIPVTQAEWSTTSFSLLAGFTNAEQQDRLKLARAGTATGDRLLFEVLLAGAVGMVAVGMFIYLMARFGKRISAELTDLQRAALELATERLPLVVERLSHGDDIAPAEPDPPPAGRITEIVRVAEAFSSVRRTAEEAAAGQARLRRGVSQVFRNLAWRNQSLLHRQLALLDTMERRSTEPETLEELFRLDHLTTRMRRLAEGLIILSGAPPGRGWREPVPLVDVLRGAVAEVEDYTRISVAARSDDAVVGAAVADVIHLLAELIENAATNSPARTEVTVRAERVAHGIVIEIEDRGLGMRDDEIEAANELFANPPEFDLADSDKLGFFVVARLAARHQIKITLRTSPYGGVTAIVLLSHAITLQHTADGAAGDLLPLPTGALPTGSGAGHSRAGRAELGHARAADALTAGADPLPSVSLAPEPMLVPAPVALPEPWLMPAPVEAPSAPPAPPAMRAASIVPPASAAVAGAVASDGIGPLPDGMLSWVPPPEPDDYTFSEYPELPQRIREASLRPERRRDTGSSSGSPPWAGDTGGSSGSSPWASDTGSSSGSSPWASNAGGSRGSSPWASDAGSSSGSSPWASNTGSSSGSSPWASNTGGSRGSSPWASTENPVLSPGGQPPPPPEVTGERTPMESGALFASLQQGWQRGRTEAERVVEQADEGGAGVKQADEGGAGGDDTGKYPAHGYPATGQEQHEQRADG